MATVASKMITLADEVRELSGTTSKLGIDAMTSNVSAANDRIDAQATTIAEIVALLEGKSVPGGGSSGGGSIETCTVTVEHTLGLTLSGGGSITYTVYDNGTFTTNNISFTPLYARRVLENVVCGSAITIFIGTSGSYISTITGNTSQIDKRRETTMFQVTNESGASDVITISAANS